MTFPQALRAILSIALLLGLAAPLQARPGGPDREAPAVRDHYTKREVLIPMRDGVKLFTAIYTPKEASRAYPILLQRTPYSISPYGEEAFPGLLGPSSRFQEEGFIFVYQDVRGRMMSEGEFVNMRPQRALSGASVDESTDTFDTLDWLLKHVDGHNGKVGQWGISYPGFYTAAGMLSGHPALKAVSPQAPIVDWFAGDDFHRNGALWLPHAFNFMVGFGKPRPKPTTAWPAPLRHGTSDGYEWFLRLGSTAATRQYTKDVPFWNEMLDHPEYDAFWQARNLRPHLKDVKPAVLTVGGWFDAENLFGALQVFQALDRQSPATDSRLVMGPWFHGGWERSQGDHLGPVRFGSETSEWFQAEVLFPFFMHHLKGAKHPGLPKATVFETGANRWHKLDAWPPKQAKDTKLFLHPNGRLAFTPPSSEGGADAFISDPSKPVPFIEQVAIGMPKEYMVADQRFAGRRPDVLVFQTEPLKEDLTLAGPLKPELFVATTGTDADWVVKLIDVYPDDFRNPDFKPGGPPWEPTPNPMGGYQQLVRGEVMRGKFRDGLDKPAPFTPGQPTRVAWSMNDIFHTFRKGHRIMIQIQSTWFPLMDRNPQQFMNINQAKPEDYRKATHTVFHDAARPSRLQLKIWRHAGESSPVDLEDPVLLRNLSEPEAGKILFDGFKAAMNTLTIQDTGSSRIEDYLRLRDTRPFRTGNRPFLAASKSLFNRIVGEPNAGGFELSFAAFLQGAEDVETFAKNYLAVGFKLDYVKADGDLSTYTPDFLARTKNGVVWIIETKGREEPDLPQKMSRLRQWCEDATQASKDDGGTTYRFVNVDQDGFEKHTPKTLAALAASFTEYQGGSISANPQGEREPRTAGRKMEALK